MVYREGEQLLAGYGFDGPAVSNNHAEYVGLIEALKSVIDYAEEEEVVVKSDSRMLVNQMSSIWKVSKKALASTVEGSYAEKFLEAKEIARGFDELRFVWIPREQNSEADGLSRLAYREHLAEKRKNRCGAD